MKKKNSIKRAQSQAGLSFAERKNFRPMAKIFTMLVLLMTAVTGAWAQDQLQTEYTSNATLNNVTVSADMEIAIGDGAVVTINNGLTIAEGKTLTVNGPGKLVVNGTNGSQGSQGQMMTGNPGGQGTDGSAAITGNIVIKGATVEANGGYGGQGGTGGAGTSGSNPGQGGKGGKGGKGGAAFTGAVTIFSGTITAKGGGGGDGGGEGAGGMNPMDFQNPGPEGEKGEGGDGGNAFAGMLTFYGGTVKADGGRCGYGKPDGNTAKAFANDVTMNAATYELRGSNTGNNTAIELADIVNYRYVDITAADAKDPNDLTLNDDKTEATMEMPANDVTIDYELVRDMAVDMPITVGTGQDNYRIRVKKEGDSFVPAEMTLQQMMALFNVHDGIENQDLVFYGDGKVCDISIFAVDDQGQPTGDAIAFQSLTPGRYVAIATAQEGTIYDGQTGQSNIFTLFEGFEVEVAAQGFATYYKDEPLTLDTDETAAALYTVSSVTANEAVLSNAIEAAPANTPLLIYNSSNEPKTVLLIPTDEPNLALTVAPEFQGTLEAKTFTADDMAAYNHYMLTEANAFVWVREAGTIAANRCWLQIAASAPTKARKLVFGEATGLKAIDNGERTIDNWYDLNGRKLNAVPTKKGVYIMNGKKVVVK